MARPDEHLAAARHQRGRSSITMSPGSAMTSARRAAAIASMIRAMTETAAKLARLRALVAARELPGIVLTRPATVAWLTGGATNVIDRSAATDAVWIAVGPDTGACISTIVEGPRLRGRVRAPVRVGRGAVADPDAYRRAAVEASAPGQRTTTCWTTT